MNNERRKTLYKIIDQIESLKSAVNALRNEVGDIRDQLDVEHDNEEESFNNMPESLQQGEKGQDMQIAIEYIELASSAVGDLFTALEDFDFDDIVSNIDNARGQA
jgi:hypothetical protein